MLADSPTAAWTLATTSHHPSPQTPRQTEEQPRCGIRIAGESLGILATGPRLNLRSVGLWTNQLPPQPYSPCITCRRQLRSDPSARASCVPAGGTRTLRFGISTLVGMGLLATGIATGGAAAAPQGSTPLDANEDIAWKGCGEQLECATVRVPLDWDHPRGRQIKLAVIRHLASRPEERIGSMFVNPGGPGGSVQAVRDDASEFWTPAGQGRFDVVGWDIRGAPSARRRGGQHPCAVLSQREAQGAVSRRPVDSRDGARSRVAYARTTAAPSRDAAARSAAAFSATSPPPTRPAISITCAGSSATRASPTWASPRALHRADLRQHVPPPRAGAGPGRRGRPGRLHPGNRGGVREPTRSQRPRVRGLPVAVPKRGAGPLRARGRRLGRGARR